MPKTARPVVWEGAGAKSPSLDLIQGARPTWVSCCRSNFLSEAHTQLVLLRKGGIVEAKRGFELLHPDFLLFPTFEHQHADWLKPEFQGLAGTPAGAEIHIEYLARVTDIFPAPDSIHAASIRNDRFLAMRCEYRPGLPLNLILVRVYRLAHPCVIPNRPSYAGCKSRVNLTEEIVIGGATPVLEDDAYERMRNFS